jgi:hypothetical protein
MNEAIILQDGQKKKVAFPPTHFSHDCEFSFLESIVIE